MLGDENALYFVKISRGLCQTMLQSDTATGAGGSVPSCVSLDFLFLRKHTGKREILCTGRCQKFEHFMRIL